MTDSDFEALLSLLPSLENTARCHGNASSRAMANDIKTFISTRGEVSTNRSGFVQRDSEEGNIIYSLSIRQKLLQKEAIPLK